MEKHILTAHLKLPRLLTTCLLITLPLLCTAETVDTARTAAPDAEPAWVAPAAAPPAPAKSTPIPAAMSLQPSAGVTLPIAPFDLWDRIRDGFAMEPLPDDRLVYRQIAWFAARPDYVERTVERSRRYLYFIVEEVQRRGMPMEIALLPIVESAFNPHALSRSQASGMWQFIPSTGRIFGLQQDWWYDGRKDVVAATYSALDYLQKLYDEFGSWELALAGYNCGEGKIRREIAYNVAHNRPTDYQSLNLPDETRNYVPKLMAARAIVLEPERYGLTLAAIPDEPYFAAVTTRKKLDTKIAAQFAEMSSEEFLMLNPGFNRPVISLDFNREKTILVPAGVTDRFVARLEDPNAKLLSWKTHQLRRGEPLDKVASQYGLSSEELKRINGIASNKKVAGGGTILVPDKPGTPKGTLELDGKPESEFSPPAQPAHAKHGKKVAHKSKAAKSGAKAKVTTPAHAAKKSAPQKPPQPQQK